MDQFYSNGIPFPTTRSRLDIIIDWFLLIKWHLTVTLMSIVLTTLEVKHLFTHWLAILRFSSAKYRFTTFADVSMRCLSPNCSLTWCCLFIPLLPFWHPVLRSTLIFRVLHPIPTGELFPLPSALHGGSKFHVSQPEPTTAEGFTPGLAQSEGNSSRRWSPKVSSFNF